MSLKIRQAISLSVVLIRRLSIKLDQMDNDESVAQMSTQQLEKVYKSTGKMLERFAFHYEIIRKQEKKWTRIKEMHPVEVKVYEEYIKNHGDYRLVLQLAQSSHVKCKQVFDEVHRQIQRRLPQFPIDNYMHIE